MKYQIKETAKGGEKSWRAMWSDTYIEGTVSYVSADDCERKLRNIKAKPTITVVKEIEL